MKSGDRITPTVSLQRRIGEGGMSEVWSASQPTLRREVAVKLPCERLLTHPEVLWRFSLEAQTTARIASPHVPQIFDCGTLPDGAPFIVMELVEGTSLQAWLERHGRFTTAQTSRLLTQVGTMLARAHDLGIVHRDIKPDNIVLAPGDGDHFIAKVLDFGLAKPPTDTHSADQTLAGVTLGTPLFMSPEQFVDAKSVDAHADMWSLAVVAYRCLTGALPFHGKTLHAVFHSIERGHFRMPSALHPELPRAIDLWFTRAFARNPEKRFASASDMAIEFASAMRAPARRRSRAGLVAGGVAAAIALATLVVVALAPLETTRAQTRATLAESPETFEIERELPPVAPFPCVDREPRPAVATRARSHRAPFERTATPEARTLSGSTADEAYPSPERGTARSAP